MARLAMRLSYFFVPNFPEEFDGGRTMASVMVVHEALRVHQELWIYPTEY